MGGGGPPCRKIRSRKLQQNPPGAAFGGAPRGASRPWEGEYKEISLIFPAGRRNIRKFSLYFRPGGRAWGRGPVKSGAILLEVSGTYFSAGRSTPTLWQYSQWVFLDQAAAGDMLSFLR